MARHLGRWAKERWHGVVDEIVLIALARAGSLPHMRLTGMVMGIYSVLPNAKGCKVTYLEGDGNLGKSFEAIRWHLTCFESRSEFLWVA